MNLEILNVRKAMIRLMWAFYFDVEHQPNETDLAILNCLQKECYNGETNGLWTITDLKKELNLDYKEILKSCYDLLKPSNAIKISEAKEIGLTGHKTIIQLTSIGLEFVKEANFYARKNMQELEEKFKLGHNKTKEQKIESWIDAKDEIETLKEYQKNIENSIPNFKEELKKYKELVA